MGKSKKPFIDKKKASTYHLLHRSQRDVSEQDNETGDVGPTTILWPSPNNNVETDEKVLNAKNNTTERHNVMGEWKAQMQEVGLVDDYDYNTHLKPITGSGTFLDPKGHHLDPLRDPRAQPLQEIEEVSRQLESIALTPDCMDDDVAQALFGDFEEGDFEEILDDFCLTAAQEPDEEEETAFDYDEHIRNLMERAIAQQQEDVVHLKEHEWGRGDETFFSKGRALNQRHERDDDDDDSGYYDEDALLNVHDTPGVVSALTEEEERALCEKFQQTLAEYDSDEVGDLDNECEEIRGARPLEGDAQIEALLDEFEMEKRDEFFMEGAGHLAEQRRTGGSSFAALVGKNLVSAKELDDPALNDEDDVAPPLEEVFADANLVLAHPAMEPPPEEILIDGKSYFSETARNPWDCESILSTYSNLDNNPVTISTKSRRRKKKVTPETLPEETEAAPVQIQLSNKTGLPLGVLPSRPHYYEGDDTIASVNKGVARKKNETKEEKKARKAAVKQEREIARMQKKMLREAFQDEFAKRAGNVIADDVGGKSVFRYS